MLKTIKPTKNGINGEWILYARKSTESEDRQIQSIDDQLGYLKEIAHRESLNICEIICEAKSAKAPDTREGFKKLLDLIETRKVHGVLVWKLDRLSRNPIDSARIQWYLQTGKIRCIRTSERSYWPEDNALLFAVEQGMANQYIRDLSRNVKRGLYSKAEKGWFPGVPPIGYLNSKTGEMGKEEIIIDPDRYTLIRKMWDLMLTGTYTTAEIWRIATNEWGLLTPKRKKLGGKAMAESNFYKIFPNIFYTGNFYYAGKFYRGKHTPMVTMEEFERVQILLGKNGNRHPIAHDFPFTGIMRCANCSASITATEKKKLVKSTGEIKSYTYYHCTRKKRQVQCKARPVGLAELEKQVVQLLTENIIHPLFYEIGLEVLDENQTLERDKVKAMQESKNKQVEDTQKKLERLFTFLINGTISEDEYSRQKKELQNMINMQKAELSEVEENLLSQNETVKNVFHFAKGAINAFTEANQQTRREVFSSLGSNYKINDGKLLIDLHSWLIVLKKSENEILPEIERLELKNMNACKVNERFSHFSLLMSGCRESNSALFAMRHGDLPDLRIKTESGCRESNSALLFPKQIYYQYTTPRLNFYPQNKYTTPPK